MAQPADRSGVRAEGREARGPDPRAQGRPHVARRGRRRVLRVAAVPRLDRGPPGLRQSRRAGLLPGSATAIRRRRGDGARADRALCGLSARHGHPVPPLREPRDPRAAGALREPARRRRRRAGARRPRPRRQAHQHPPHHGPAPRRTLPAGQPDVAAARAELPVPRLPVGRQRLASRQPRESLAPGGVAAAARRDPGHAARRRLPVPFVDGGGPDQLGLRAARPAPANRRRHPAHLRRRARAARPGDRPGHAPAHRPPGHRPGQPGRRPANRASPDVGARLPAALRAVERRQPDRRPLPGHAAVPLPVPAHAGRARARRRGHPQLGLPQGRPRHHERHQLHGALPARPAGAQGRLGHRAEGDGRRPAARRPQPAARALRRAERGDPGRTGGARHLPCARLRTLQRHDDDDAGPDRLAADDALGAVPRRSAAHEARHHQDLGERGAPGAARRRVAGHGHAGASVRRAARPDHADRRLRQPGGQLQRGDRRHVGLGQVAAAERDRRRLPRHRRARLDHRRRPLLREGVPQLRRQLHRVHRGRRAVAQPVPPGRGHRRGHGTPAAPARADGVPARVARRLSVLDAGRGDQEGLEGQGPRHDRHRHSRPARDRTPRRR